MFIGVPDIEPVVRGADLDFVPFCENEYPPGSMAKRWTGVAKLHGLDVARYTTRELTPGLVKAALEHLANENDSDEILTQVLMALPENRVGMPSSELREVGKQIRTITFRAASAASSGPYGAGKSTAGFNWSSETTSRSALNHGASSGVFKTRQEPYEVASQNSTRSPGMIADH